jgi:hypothetical protein
LSCARKSSYREGNERKDKKKGSGSRVKYIQKVRPQTEDMEERGMMSN